jgi:hypothetical protein
MFRALFYLQNDPVQLQYESVCKIQLPRPCISIKILANQNGAVDTVGVDMLRQVCRSYIEAPQNPNSWRIRLWKRVQLTHEPFSSPWDVVARESSPKIVSIERYRGESMDSDRSGLEYTARIEHSWRPQ